MDSILESTLTQKKSAGPKRKLNSYELQQEEENAIWSQIARANMNRALGN